MSLLSSWGSKEPKSGDEDMSTARISTLSLADQSNALFESLRSGDISAIRNLLQVNRTLLNEKMYGFEGHDIYGTVPESKSRRCYSWTGNIKDGYFYPLHVAAEMGHKSLIILLVQAGADQALTDYRGETAEQKCNGEGKYAFYELRGLRFQAEEKYEGQVDRAGNRSRNGSLYYKPEGYHETMHLLYRGGWKDNLYHGHGSLYFMGSSQLKYFGRFKNGHFHGAGSLFDQEGEKLYSGNFREGHKDGRGEEYSQGKLPLLYQMYKGDFSAGARHGFGIAILSEGHRYMGRFDKGVMSGVGVYFHPNGNRFEGNYFNNKPDGHGSFYEVDPETGLERSATHALWTMGRKTEIVEEPFQPKPSELPFGLTAGSSAVNVTSKAHRDRTASIDGRERGHSADAGDPTSTPAFRTDEDWKKDLGKHLRLKFKEAKAFDVVEELEIAEPENPEEEEVTAEEEYLEDNDDVNGFHFVEVPALFVAYSYVCAAAKTFEERKITRDFRNLPDFEQIYHLVIDAVDTYNERWEKEVKKQEADRLERERQAVLAAQQAEEDRAKELREKKTQKVAAIAGRAVNGPSTASSVSPSPSVVSISGGNSAMLTSSEGVGLLSNSTAHGGKGLTALLSSVKGGESGSKLKHVKSEETQNKRFIFMSEAEKKEEMRLKQRAELNAKQAGVLLDPETEAQLGNEILEALEEDIVNELEIEIEVDIDDDEDTATDTGATAATGLDDSAVGWHRSSSVHSDEVQALRDDEAVFGRRRKMRTTTKGTVVIVNEFASELLYIMRTATDMLG